MSKFRKQNPEDIGTTKQVWLQFLKFEKSGMSCAIHEIVFYDTDAWNCSQYLHVKSSCQLYNCPFPFLQLPYPVFHRVERHKHFTAPAHPPSHIQVSIQEGISQKKLWNMLCGDNGVSYKKCVFLTDAIPTGKTSFYPFLCIIQPSHLFSIFASLPPISPLTPLIAWISAGCSPFIVLPAFASTHLLPI